MSNQAENELRTDLLAALLELSKFIAEQEIDGQDD
jgi:hypothetical protein